MANDAPQVMGGMGYSQTANLLMGELTDCGHDLVAGANIRVEHQHTLGGDDERGVAGAGGVLHHVYVVGDLAQHHGGGGGFGGQRLAHRGYDNCGGADDELQ